MRVVSLNLDHGDATVVRRALKQALDRCACSGLPSRISCTDCQALAATIAELDRLVYRPAFGRTPLLTLVAANACGHLQSPMTDPDSDELDDNEHLRLLVRDEGGRGNR